MTVNNKTFDQWSALIRKKQDTKEVHRIIATVFDVVGLLSKRKMSGKLIFTCSLSVDEIAALDVRIVALQSSNGNLQIQFNTDGTSI